MMKTHLKGLTLVSCAVLVMGLVSCSGKKTNQYSAANEKGKLKIGFSIDTLIVERWRQDCDVFVSRAQDCGASVIIQDAANSLEEQIIQIEFLIEQNVDALVIIPKDSEALKNVLLKAKAKNIPVIAYDRLIRDSDVALYITVDCEKVGNLMAQAVLNKKSTGSIWCIYGSPADFNMILVDEGVKQGVSGSGAAITYKYYTQDWNYDLAYQQMNSLLNAQKAPSAVICGNDAIAESVIRSLSEHRAGKNVSVVGQDAEALACRRIVDGVQTATVYKPIQRLAEMAAESACLLASGKKPEELEGVNDSISNGAINVPVIKLEPVLVTKENMDEVIVKSGFHSREEIYR